MLILLAQATHNHRAHLACGVLREHGVEAHVFHENSGVLHGGASTTTASLWVQDDEWEEAREILATAPIEPLPEGDGESMNIPREFFPPWEAVALGVAGAIFACPTVVKIAAVAPKIPFLNPDQIFDTLLALPLVLLVDAGSALVLGLIAGLVTAPAFAVLRWHREQWWPAVALLTLVAVILALTAAVVGFH